MLNIQEEEKDNNIQERSYLNLVNKILDEGEERTTRNAVVYSLFGERLEFDMSDGTIPILTTKKVSFKNVFYELMFFLKGLTDTKYMEDKGVNIWKGNTTRNFLDSRNLDYKEGVTGPIYGFQWNHFGADYKGPNHNYTNEGINQIDECINMIQNDPTSRRILFSAWNPIDLNKMCLPPCFTENTLVYTINGYKNIKDVNEGEYLYTHLGNCKKITKKYITEYNNNKLIKLKVKYIPIIETTPNHPFYVRKVNYITTPRLKIINKENPEWIIADNIEDNYYHGIKINDKNIIPEFNIEKNINQYSSNIINKKLDDKNEWYFLGYYLGDGWSRQDRKGTFFLVFNNNDEKELTEKFNKIISNNKVKVRQSGCVVYTYYDCVFDFIVKMFGYKAHNKVIPEWVMNAPIEYLQEFINGYIKADGCIHKNNLIDITTTSVDIAYKIQLILLKLNIISSVTYQERPNKCIIEGRLVNQRNTYSIKFYKNRKNPIRSFIDKGYAWFPFISKEYIDIEKTYVYNFDVEDDHTYIINNICVHNCHIMFQFYVRKGEYLDGQLYQRSADLMLGVPYNILSYSLLLYMVAKITNLKVGRLVMTFGDIHIYKDHIDGAKEQISRLPYKFPKFSVKCVKSIREYDIDDFEMNDYKSYPNIKMKMVA